jgi:peptidoglycan/xylan/chitin deacetylase (PgdA/CDA1 family)
VKEERAKRRIEALLAAWMPGVRSTNRIVVLCYHSVHPWSPMRSATPVIFERQLEWLQEHCRVVSFRSILQVRSDDSDRRPLVALTFDDGYEDNHRYALPILQRVGLAATVFVTTGLVERNGQVVERFARSWGVSADHVRGLSWRQIEEMRAAGLEVGAHTRTHPVLSRLDDSEVRAEVEGSKAILEDHLGEPVVTFAYPYGKPREHVSDRNREVVAQLGIESAAAILYRGVRPNEDPLVIPRFPVTNDTMEIFRGKVGGRLDAIGFWQSHAPRPLADLIATDPSMELRQRHDTEGTAPPIDTRDPDRSTGPRSGLVVLPSPRAPRWLIPREPPRHTMAGLAIEQPIALSSRLGWMAARSLAHRGAFNLLRTYEFLPREIAEASEAFIPRHGGVAFSRSSHPGRFNGLVFDGEGRPCVFIKVARDALGARALSREAEALDEFASHVPPPVFPPTVMSKSDGVLVLSAFDWRPRPSPWRLPEEVAYAMGLFFRSTSHTLAGGAAHGDFVPRNLLSIDGGWGLVGWAHARRSASPYSDLFHYLVLSYTTLRKPTLRSIRSGLKGAGPVGAAISAYASGAEVDAAESGRFFRDYLTEVSDSEPGIRRRVMGLRAATSGV